MQRRTKFNKDYEAKKTRLRGWPCRCTIGKDIGSFFSGDARPPVSARGAATPESCAQNTRVAVRCRLQEYRERFRERRAHSFPSSINRMVSTQHVLLINWSSVMKPYIVKAGSGVRPQTGTPFVYASSYLSQKSLHPVILSTVRRAVAYCFKTSKESECELVHLCKSIRKFR